MISQIEPVIHSDIIRNDTDWDEKKYITFNNKDALIKEDKV